MAVDWDIKPPYVFFPGVDLVLNSLAEEKLQASLRCLARHGRFLEIGKYDLSNNTPLGVSQMYNNFWINQKSSWIYYSLTFTLKYS